AGTFSLNFLGRVEALLCREEQVATRLGTAAKGTADVMPLVTDLDNLEGDVGALQKALLPVVLGTIKSAGVRTPEGSFIPVNRANLFQLDKVVVGLAHPNATGAQALQSVNNLLQPIVHLTLGYNPIHAANNALQNAASNRAMIPFVGGIVNNTAGAYLRSGANLAYGIGLAVETTERYLGAGADSAAQLQTLARLLTPLLEGRIGARIQGELNALNAVTGLDPTSKAVVKAEVSLFNDALSALHDLNTHTPGSVGAQLVHARATLQANLPTTPQAPCPDADISATPVVVVRQLGATSGLANATILFTNTGNAALSATVSTNLPGVITLVKTNFPNVMPGTTQGIHIGINPSTLPAGITQGVVTISDPNANLVQTVPVTIVINHVPPGSDTGMGKPTSNSCEGNWIDAEKPPVVSLKVTSTGGDLNTTEGPGGLTGSGTLSNITTDANGVCTATVTGDFMSPNGNPLAGLVIHMSRVDNELRVVV